MMGRHCLLLCMLGLVTALVVALFQHTPGYMDADYYYAGGLRLAQGYGFSELILWNYLDDPTGLPHPSHAYWMPMASILAASGMKLPGLERFTAARLGFLALVAILPILTASLSFALTKRRDTAILSGVLAIFSAFYLPYMPTTDVFGLYMVLGASFWLLIGDRWQSADSPSFNSALNALLLGLLAGLMHLTRADGLVWLFSAFIAIGLQPAASGTRLSRSRFYVLHGSFCLLGYLSVMGPWMWRNLLAFGTLLAPGGMRALWVTSYDELYIYPADLLTPARWWQSGLGNIFQARLWALGQNMQTTLAVQGGIFLMPLILMGFWRLRHDLRIQVGSISWLATFLVMTVVFPFSGARGGMFHSGAALQPLFWAVVPVGLDVFISWGRRLRGWQVSQARNFFQVGLVGLAITLTLFVISGRVIRGDLSQPAWGEKHRLYSRLEEALQDHGAQPEEVVMVNNSPAYFIASGRPVLSIPYGNLETLLTVADRYQVDYLLLEFNQFQGEDDLYADPGDRPGLHYLMTLEDTHIFQFVGR